MKSSVVAQVSSSSARWKTSSASSSKPKLTVEVAEIDVRLNQRRVQPDRAHVRRDGALRIAQVLSGKRQVIARLRVRWLGRDGLLEGFLGHLVSRLCGGLVALAHVRLPRRSTQLSGPT